MKAVTVVALAAISLACFAQTGQVVIRKDGDAMKSLTKILNLTPDQAKKLSAIRNQEMAEVRKSGPNLSPDKVQKIFHSHDGELKKFLSKEQFAKLDAMRNNMRIVNRGK